MNVYVGLNLLSILFPLIFSFHPRIAFHKEWRYVIPAIGITAVVYLLWDILVTAQGHWRFNPDYSGEAVFGGLPLGEVLFFFCIPYACLFVYRIFRIFFQARLLPIPLSVFWALAGVFLLSSVLNLQRGYTMLAFLSCAAFLALALKLKPSLLQSSHTWEYFLFSFGAFLFVNGILTGLPVVLYNPDMILGYRVITIPVEDFFYNFSFLGFNLLLYRLLAGDD
ncbi:MAG: lycopene cyclase domain-containing protein [Spirochaetes bacterium]|nr:lycopene cyclase domain-containing protein [Spirochaetota bacterium]